MLGDIWDKYSFSKVSQTPPLENCALNYVWINNTRDTPRTKPNEPLCTVPLDYVDKAYANATRYPDTDFNLWIDEALLDDSSLFFLRSHAYLHAPPNVTLRDLNDIPSYAENPIFKPESKTSIWVRADLARLLTIAHGFDETAYDHIFYSDFDVEDIKMTCPFAANIMNEYGLFCGCTIEKDSIIENSFMAFRRGDGEAFLREQLIPSTIADALKGNNGYGALMQELRKLEAKLGVKDIAERIIEPRAPRSGDQMKRAPFYQQHGIL